MWPPHVCPKLPYNMAASDPHSYVVAQGLKRTGRKQYYLSCPTLEATQHHVHHTRLVIQSLREAQIQRMGTQTLFLNRRTIRKSASKF